MLAGAEHGLLPQGLGWLPASALHGSLIVLLRFTKCVLGRVGRGWGGGSRL